MTVRWVITHLLELPIESRTKQAIGGDAAAFGYQEHLLADLRDLLLVTQYFTAVAASKGLTKSEQQKMMRGMPNRIRRPGEPEEKPRMATPEELAAMFNANKKALARRQMRKARGG